MSLVRWFRKNNSKVMAVVVIVIMFGFIGGSYLSYLGRRRSPLNKAVAFYLDDIKISQNDLNAAHNELETLTMVLADDLLRAQDIEGIALAELLFTAKQKNVDLVRFTRQIITRQEYRIRGANLGPIYERTMIPAFYWVLLKAEATRAGVSVSNTEAAQLLNQSIPVLTEGTITYPRMIQELGKRGYTEKALLEAMGDLLAVLQYCRYVCSNEDLTLSEMALDAAYNMEIVDANVVKFDASVFVKDAPEPSEDELLAHFEKHKDFLQGHTTQDYPYGFGYKIPDRVQLEYIAIKLGDVKQTIPAPSAEETEIYYRTHQSRFVRQVAPDPNDPNSTVGKTEVTPYAEVAQIIADELTDKKIYAQAEAILQEAILLSEINIHADGLDPQDLTSEQFEKYAVDYEKIAQQITRSYGIRVYSGKTGMLGPRDMNVDRYLSTMTIDGNGYFPVSLAHVAFAVDGLEVSKLSPFDAQPPNLFENIGPVKDALATVFSSLDDPARQVCAIMRVVKTEKARVAESIDESYETNSLALDPNDPNDPNDKSEEQVYSARKMVTEDVKKLKAMETTKAKALEFIEQAKGEGWETAVEKFNELYPKEPTEDDDDPNTFSVQTVTGSKRSSEARFEALRVMNEGYPNARLILLANELEDMLCRQLYDLVPAESEGISEPNDPIEFKPATSYLCVKDVSINRLWKEGFEVNKPLVANRLDKIQSQSLSVIHLDPKNIEKRMKFRWAVKDTDDGEPNTAASDVPDASMAGGDGDGTDASQQAEGQ